MKKSKYPRLRTKVYRGVGGQSWSYYVYDMRGTGKPDVRLGTDYAKAVEQWRKLYEHLPLTLGRLQEAFDRWRERELPQYENLETRSSYERHLGRLEPVFGNAAWHEGNRELSVLSIIWGKARLWGMTALPWPAAGVKDWKNPEKARTFEVTDGLFAAVYEHADRILRDCMDIATATGMRITDARTVRMPVDGKLRFKAAKTGKWAFFEISQSPVLSALLERREASRAECVMLLATDTGREVTRTMLRDRWDTARERAALAYPKLAADIRSMYLRDMRKRAADLADDTDAASRLLQHSSVKLTSAHYRTRATKLKAVR